MAKMELKDTAKRSEMQGYTAEQRILAHEEVKLPMSRSTASRPTFPQKPHDIPLGAVQHLPRSNTTPTVHKSVRPSVFHIVLPKPSKDPSPTNCHLSSENCRHQESAAANTSAQQESYYHVMGVLSMRGHFVREPGCPETSLYPASTAC